MAKGVYKLRYCLPILLIGFDYPTCFNNFFKKNDRNHPKVYANTVCMKFLSIGLNIIIFITHG